MYVAWLGACVKLWFADDDLFDSWWRAKLLIQVKMVVDEGLDVAFGFTARNEIINGKAAVIGFLLLLDFELLTGKGLLKGTGFLDFIYSVSNALQ